MESLFAWFCNVFQGKNFNNLQNLLLCISKIRFSFQTFLKDCIEVIYSGSSFFVTNTTYIAFGILAHDLNLPVQTVFGYSAELGTSLLLYLFCLKGWCLDYDFFLSKIFNFSHNFNSSFFNPSRNFLILLILLYLSLQVLNIQSNNLWVIILLLGIVWK